MRHIGKMSPGGPKAQEVGNAIREGAYAFLKRQYKTIAIITVVVFVLLWVALPSGYLGVGTAAAFLVGAVASLAAGYIAMDNATKANVRTVAAAKDGAEKALKTAFYGGATMGMAVVGLSLLGVSFLFLLYGGYNALFNTLMLLKLQRLDRDAASGIVGMGFGASLIALFAQLGGGIYTKAADVGADLVGKVEAGIPEDDPRNPAVIADNVGDNVGDSAGRGADLFESATGENIGGMIIGGLISIATGNLIFLIFPLDCSSLRNLCNISRHAIRETQRSRSQASNESIAKRPHGNNNSVRYSVSVCNNFPVRQRTILFDFLLSVLLLTFRIRCKRGNRLHNRLLYRK